MLEESVATCLMGEVVIKQVLYDPRSMLVQHARPTAGGAGREVLVTSEPPLDAAFAHLEHFSRSAKRVALLSNSVDNTPAQIG